MTGCAQPPPPVSEKVQAAYEAGQTLSVEKAKPLAVFIGDSYTQGTGASKDETRWVDLVAKAEGWGYDNLGRGGTGYLATSGKAGCGLEVCPNYAEMVETVAAIKPATVIVAGGQNDFSAFNENRPAVLAQIAKTYNGLRAKLPKARIIAVGPSTPWGVNEDVLAFDAAVQEAAASVKAEHVSLIEPNVVTPQMVLPDGGHVNDAGHKAIAERVISALR